jgi:hypothetical protein
LVQNVSSFFVMSPSTLKLMSEYNVQLWKRGGFYSTTISLLIGLHRYHLDRQERLTF